MKLIYSICIGVFISMAFFPSVLWANQSIEIMVDEEKLNSDVPPLKEENRIFIPLRVVSESLGAKVKWDNSKKTVTITNIENNVHLMIGKLKAYINGNSIALDVPARITDGRTLVPLRFVAEALGADVYWDENSQIVWINNQYVLSSLENGEGYILNPDNGLLYYADKDKSFTKISALGLTDGFLKMEVQQTPNGNKIATIVNTYGEPSIINKVHSLYLYKNKVKHRATARYFNRFEKNVTLFEDKVVITDGKKAYLISDITGEVLEVYDLQELGESKGNYFIEGIGENFILIRHNSAGFLTLINLVAESKVLLYQELLNEVEKEFVENNDVPYHGDYLRFTGKKDQTLYFENRRFIGDKETDNYQYVLK
ncbi:copper amine oxidase N-terminal domain-containing protein [Metallumcola ferriviriculae]|uniref:Copper amine oxidase N-terminal domain-containing protein n=1 Tax=Metallumcola ferriviriculae TaxID=3039180 RepID=A0AAU0UTG1_9FIRM|nr:copper amine oxidase N-terminal domain-containing protein [Desulfitibacteraceae bacterium MK1]